MTSTPWINQRLSDCPGHLWIQSLVKVKTSNCEYLARVLAAGRKAVFIQPEGRPDVRPKWCPAELVQVIEPGGSER